MPSDYPADIEDAYRPLFRVPKSALIGFLLDFEGEALDQAFAKVTKSAPPATDTALADLRPADLIRIAQACPSITPDHARELHDDHRYRGMKSLYIAEFMSDIPPSADLDSIETLNKRILEAEALLSETVAVLPHPKVKEIEWIGSTIGDVCEISYTYVASVQVVEPESELPKPVDDLRRGFAWLSPQGRWLTVCARDALMNVVLVDAIELHTGVPVKPIVIPKTVIRKLHPISKIRRLSTLDHRTQIRRRLGGKNLYNDPQARAELEAQDDHYDRIGSAYDEELDDDTKFFLDLNGIRGRISFSRDLSVGQMRLWGPNKIGQLVDNTRLERANNPSAFIEPITEKVLGSLRKDTREHITSIALAVLRCKLDGLTVTPLESDALTMQPFLRSYMRPYYLVDCPECDELTELQCASCHEDKFNISEGKLACRLCKALVQPDNVQCAAGHTVVMPHLANLVNLIPEDILLDRVAKLLSETDSQTFNVKKEFFRISGSTLFYGRPNEHIIYTIQEIPEFQALLAEPAKDDELQPILARLSKFKEKCDTPTNEKCATCLHDNHGTGCYIRLFGLFDPEYTPKPHQGHEFGDYARNITVESGSCELVVEMKSRNRSRHH